ncbi:MAG: hypothetical protein GXP29_07420 [Planctomycetes bacterium]|nr:hypothetical protein [Planctomycetota bacterium]
MIEPEGYVFLDADHGWGHIVTLRIVDWGDAQIHISVTDSARRQKIGHLSRTEYQRLIAELRSLRVFDLDSFSRDNVSDADLYRIDIRVGQQRNRIRIYCPWQDLGDTDTPGMFAAVYSVGSKPHGDLVRRLLHEAERDDLRWDVSTYSFHPDRRLVNTAGAEVEDVFFSDDGELNYATTEYPKWAGGSADEEEGCVVWHSADNPQQQPQRVPFDVIDGGDDEGVGPMFPRPTTVASAAFPELPTFEYFEVGHLAQRRVLCDGRVELCVKAKHGTRLIAYLRDHPSAYQPILWLDEVPVHRKHIDVSPDGTRAAWIDKGRLFVTDHVSTDCEWLLERLESSVEE